MLIQGIYISGKAWQIEADQWCNSSKMLQDYKRPVTKHSHRQLRFILPHLKILHNSCEYTKCCTNVHVHALYCDNLDHLVASE